jgi:hypothetical protein
MSLPVVNFRKDITKTKTEAHKLERTQALILINGEEQHVLNRRAVHRPDVMLSSSAKTNPRLSSNMDNNRILHNSVR